MNIYQERILPLFQKSGLNDQQLEQEIGLPRGILYDWKKGRTKSYKNYCGQIASYFHVSTDYLLGNTDEPYPAGQKESPQPEAEDEDPIKKKLYDMIDKMSRGELMLLLEKAENIEKL